MASCVFNYSCYVVGPAVSPVVLVVLVWPAVSPVVLVVIVWPAVSQVFLLM